MRKPYSKANNCLLARRLANKLTQDELKAYLTHQQAKKDLERQVRAIEKEMGVLKETIIHKIKGHFYQERGPYKVKLVDGGTYPSWKKEFVLRLGEREAQRVIANTDPSKKLVVTMS